MQIRVHLKKFKIQLVIIFFVKLSLLIPELLYPIVYKIFIDDVIAEQRMNQMGKVVVFYIGLYLLETLLKIIHRVFDNYLFNNISHNLKMVMCRKYMYMPMNAYNMFISSDLKNRIDGDVDMTKIFILEQVFNYITALTKLLSSIIILILFNWQISIFSLAVLPISIFISNRYEKALTSHYEDIKSLDNAIEYKVQESIHNWKEIKANNLNCRNCQQYNDLLSQKHKILQHIAYTLIKRKIIINLKDSWLNQMLIYIFGGILFMINKTTMGTVVMGVQYYNNMYGALSTILDLDVALENLKPSINRVLEILAVNEWEKTNNKLCLSGEKTAIQIKHLYFRYNAEQDYVLKDVNLKIDKQEKILILGESGGGKTTLINIILGYLQLKDGEIFIYNKNIDKLTQHVLFSKIVAIYQEPYFMNLSIKEYMMLGNPNACIKKIEEVCKSVGLLNYIQQLPDKFETMLGEQGERFSGGQKQRLAIARLLLTDKDIIILDESFSAIDGHDKNLILHEIMKKFYDKTIICISHDESITSFFGKKYRLQHGVLVND